MIINILMIAPLAISEHNALIISSLEISPTPIVAEKNDKALVTIDLALLCIEAVIASNLLSFTANSSLNLEVKSIA